MATVNTAPPATPVWPAQERRQLGAKRRLPATPKARSELPKLSQGRNTTSTRAIPIITKPAIEDLFWLWLGNFPASVTEDDISALAKDCLSCGKDEPVDVKVLVKNGVEVSSLPSVTFRVGVEKKYRDAALDENTWPAGCRFREFVFFGTNQSHATPASGFTKTPRLKSPSA